MAGPIAQSVALQLSRWACRSSGGTATRLFEAPARGRSLPFDYELEVSYPAGDTYVLRDPYSFLPTLGELDLHLVASEGGTAHLTSSARTSARRLTGAAFAVWAPNARAVSVVGDFNGWDGRLHPMRTLGASGVWELFVPGSARGRKLQVRDPRRRRAPAEGRSARLRHGGAAAQCLRHLRVGVRVGGRRLARASPRLRRAAEPWSVYEVHLGSWRLNPLEGNRPLTYASSPTSSPSTSLDMGFTHVELLPVMEHPFAPIVGLPGHRLLRADVALRLPRTTSAPSSTACTAAASA